MKNRNGFLLVAVLFLMVLLIITVPIMVQWVKDDTRIAVKDQKSSVAFQLAEAAIDRGYWKTKSSTATFAAISMGNTVAGYNFDVTYDDVTGGTYRVRLVQGPGLDDITVFGEGRDSLKKETRAIRTVFTNVSVPGAIISGGKLVTDGGSVLHWGPVMAMGDIELSGLARTNGFPRKLSRQTVKPLDSTNDTNPPNTDSLEWWSNYNVPELPIFDFTTMRASAAASGTLNCQDKDMICAGAACNDPGDFCGCKTNKWTGSACLNSGSNCSCAGAGAARTCTGTGCTGPAGVNCVNTPKTCTGPTCVDSDAAAAGCVCTSTVNFQCCSTSGGVESCAYGGTGCVSCTLTDLYLKTTLREQDLTWYWDNGPTHLGSTTWQGKQGVKGTVVVRGDMLIKGSDEYCQQFGAAKCTVKVPQQAWREYQKNDTAASGQYPGDLGKSTNSATYKLGSNSTGELWNSGGNGLGSDLGVYGFLYIGRDFMREGDSDVYGAMWVVRNVTGSGNTMLFYNSQLKVPTLNVVLVKDSWQETAPSATAWP